MSAHALSLQGLVELAKQMVAQSDERKPYQPIADDWRHNYEMLCGWCSKQLGCDILERMIEMKDGASWPQGGWVTDPGAGVTCLSYQAKPSAKMSRQQKRAILRMSEDALPPVCGGCAARKGTEASVSLHTNRDYQAAVRNETLFVCHEDPTHQRLCGGLCRAIRNRACAQ